MNGLVRRHIIISLAEASATTPPGKHSIDFTIQKTRIDTITTADIRRSFLDYFQKNDHTLVPSSPVIPHDDPTILFTNAGMNQFKDVFTGKRRTDYSRATSSQKCIRAGGKHNDLDNVGFTARHHTFFEMLGNFSFGDYYKEEAIHFAWEWATKVIGLPKDRLYATVYETDDDAFELWGKIAPELNAGRILRFGKKDNFWSMGEVGPCGPCSELHFDRGEKFGTRPEDTINGETDRFVEIWNLVFMQDDQLPDGKVVPLPKPSVDTGAGLERWAAIVQDVDSNYGIDLFQNIIRAISETTGSSYDKNRTSHHVVADHIRALGFSIADGAGISNEGRGYVLRRILRRAARHGRLLGMHEPFMYNLIPVLAAEMGDTYPELRDKQDHIVNVIRTEEESFARTLDTGLELIDRLAKKLKSKKQTVIPGDEVFRLYDTYGFPYDLTDIIATEHGLTLDRSGFDDAMARQQEQSRAGASFKAETFAFRDEFERLGRDIPPTEFVRDGLTIEASVEAVLGADGQVAVILDRTPFYRESGGQIGDTGRIFTDSVELEVESIELYNDLYFHVGHLNRGSMEDLRSSRTVTAQVEDARRWDIMRNHTGTHLLHAALRKVLGDHVRQSGSYVGPDRLRFDFSHHQPMSDDEVTAVEKIVNEQILRDVPVETEIMELAEARKAGAMALFGEKYADQVRVVSVPGFSMELCGGTHVGNVSQIGPFFVTLETGIASGIRRIEAITGREAVNFMLEAKRFRRQAAAVVNRPEEDALSGVEQLRDSVKSLEKELKKTRATMFSGGGSNSVGDEKAIGDLTLMTHDFGESDRETMGAWLDTQKGSDRAVLALAMGTVDGKSTLMAAASNKAEKDHDIHVGNLVREGLPKFGGRGGGKPSFAQGSTADGTKPSDVFDFFEAKLREKVLQK